MEVERHLALWRLTPDGDSMTIRNSTLLPVRRPDGTPAMLDGPGLWNRTNQPARLAG
jgi:streptomycin 6-kinase